MLREPSTGTVAADSVPSQGAVFSFGCQCVSCVKMMIGHSPDDGWAFTRWWLGIHQMNVHHSFKKRLWSGKLSPQLRSFCALPSCTNKEKDVSEKRFLFNIFLSLSLAFIFSYREALCTHQSSHAVAGT